MIFNSIYLDLERRDYPNEFGFSFKCRSRCLCNFLGRHVRDKKVSTEGFNRIVIMGTKTSDLKVTINSCSVASVALPFDEARYTSLDGVRLQEFFIAMLRDGLAIFPDNCREAVDAIHKGIESFRAGGYRNEWTHKIRSFRSLGVKAALQCQLTTERFALTLVVTRGEKELLRQEILSTDPDEVAFDYRFRDIAAKDGKLVVLSKLSEPLFTVELSPLLENRSEVSS